MQVDLVKLRKVVTPLVGKKGKPVKVKESVELPITLGEKDKRRTMRHSFMVARIDAPYKIIFGRPLLNELSMVLSPQYMLMKFKTDKGIVSVRSN